MDVERVAVVVTAAVVVAPAWKLKIINNWTLSIESDDKVLVQVLQEIDWHKGKNQAG